MDSRSGGTRAWKAGIKPFQASGRAWSIWLSLMLLLGCRGAERRGFWVVENTRLGPMTIAVSPAINVSGSTDFDRSQVADLMASELGHAWGIKVIPVSRVLAAMSAQGREGIESPEHALETAGQLGADAMLVFAVTEYDPYDPPRVGLTAQLYGSRSRAGVGAIDPVDLSRRASLASAPEKRGRGGLIAETARVFDASQQGVMDDIKVFARVRGTGGSAFGWRWYVVSQREYLRYCCSATVRALLNGDEARSFPDVTDER